MNQRQIIEAMEGCRTSSDAAQQADVPELADALSQDAALRKQFERIRQWDGIVGEALHDCPIPEGLCDRLLDALALSDSGSALAKGPFESAARQFPCNETLAEPTPESHPNAGRRFLLRRSLWFAASLSAAALVLVAVALSRLGPQTPELTADFADEIIDWTQTVARSEWRTDFAASELRGAPFDPGVQSRPRRWTRIETRYAAQTVVYDLTVRQNEPTFLFCFVSGRSSLPGNPPVGPFSTTGGFSIGAWQRGDHVYVLAVRGNEARYRKLIQSPVILGNMRIRENLERIGALPIHANPDTPHFAIGAIDQV
ncbi:MAG: hypothetical protein KJ017_06150 [Alphaproteobacteria bacterium]|nr:hypothetical protein [Alphaproteobacteria bacterium]